ncbi:hypothetical protein Tsubulata_022345, partial [Turnera subulata]
VGLKGGEPEASFASFGAWELVVAVVSGAPPPPFSSSIHLFFRVEFQLKFSGKFVSGSGMDVSWSLVCVLCII